MQKIRIITDSGSDIIAPYPDNLTVLPLTIHFGDREFRDGQNLSHREFYELLLSEKELPTTSLIPPGEFAEAFRDAQKRGETVIAITLSSRLSGTWQSAVLAAEDFENVYVVDSMNATLGEQILVQYALRLVDEGLDAESVVNRLEAIKDRAVLMGMPDTLDFLHRGGRISKTTAVLGGVLSVKPVLKLIDGVVTMIGKARGSKNGNNCLIREIEKSGVDFSLPYLVGYTGLSDALLRRYIEDSRMLWQDHTDYPPVTTVGATIGTHVGPDAIVIAYFREAADSESA